MAICAEFARIKNETALLLMVCALLALLGINAIAANEVEYPVEIHTMTIEERSSFESQTEYTLIVTYLSQNNESGTNGSVCAVFSANKANMAFVMTVHRAQQTITFSYTQERRGKASARPLMLLLM